MTPARSPAPPDLMALLCLIGGAVRGAGEVGLLMQLMLVSTYCRPLQHAIESWLLTEERYAHLEFEESGFDDEDGWGGEDAMRPGWVASYGRVALWRHVTRFGLAVVIPVQWGGMILARGRLVLNCAGLTERRLLPLSFFLFFALGLAVESNCVLIVTIS